MGVSGFIQTIFLASFFVSAISLDLTPVITVPSPIKDGHTSSLDIYCRFEGQAQNIKLDFIKLNSKKDSGNTKLLAEVFPGSSPVITDVNLRSRSTIEGTIADSAPSSYLLLKIGNVSRVEVATYTCNAQYQNDSTPVPLSVDKVVDGILTPVITVPSPIKDGDTSNIDVHCRFEGQAQNIKLDFIKLNSKKDSGNTKLLAEVFPGSNPVIRDVNLMSRSTIEGTIADSAPSSYLLLKIGNVSCVEVATYTCNAQYQNDSTPVPLSVDKVVDGISDPAELEVIQHPVKTKYPVGESVKITCTGKVGKPPQVWTWYKYNEESKLWEPYTRDIVQGQQVKVTDCAFQGHSNLTFTIPDTEEHKFRCTAGHNVDFSKIISINGDVSGAESMFASSILLITSVLLTILRK